MLTDIDLSHQGKLRAALQAGSDRDLEHLAAALVGRLLGVSIAIAGSGFQHGGDAGTAGQQGRRLRLECKRYGDHTSLSNRELLGEVDQALLRDEALEAWILVATRSAPEQLVQELTRHGERQGVPVIIIDWKEHELSPLAALCASDPDLVEAVFSRQAADEARALQPVAGSAIALLRRNLESWSLGFETVRAASHRKLEGIWASPRTSKAELGQDVAGGTQEKKVRRQAVHDALDGWWLGPARNDAPAVIIGREGVGKTWAALDWLHGRITRQPIVLVIPSSAVVAVGRPSEANLKRFIADRLCDLTETRDADHWLRRLNHLLERPGEEGPVLTVLFDGLNQEPSFPWVSLLRVFQGESFEGRVRVMLSTRQHYFDDRLKHLRGLVVPAKPVITVGVYNNAPGGELDQMLGFEGLTQADLHPDLLELARTPRLFMLAVRVRGRSVASGQMTVHRLLWEYGRDTFGDRGDGSFSEDEWRAWLAGTARRYRAGIRQFTVQALGEATHRSDLTAREAYARLSDIIDGRFVQAGSPGSLQLTPTVVAHALGMALLDRLDADSDLTFAQADAELIEWLDPISGLDERAEILRAAVSIHVERNSPPDSPIGGVLVTAWLQTQNVSDSHRRELHSLAPILPEAFLDAVEHSYTFAQDSARRAAVNALRAIPREEGPPCDAIIARVRKWFCLVSREVYDRADENVDFERSRAERYRSRIGVDASGYVTVFGVELQLVDRDDGRLQMMGPSILEGFPLARIVPCFEAAAVACSVRSYAPAWQGLTWLCYLNEVDPEKTAISLRALSVDISARTPEPGVHPELQSHAAALVLSLTGREADEEESATIDADIFHHFTYERDYLSDPSRSSFEVERRHAAVVLADRSVSLHTRLQRTNDLWLDPTFQPPPEFCDDLPAEASGFDIGALCRDAGYTYEYHLFEQLEPVLARCAPELLATLARRKMQGCATCPPESRHWNAIHATEAFILAGPTEASAARALRLSGKDEDRHREASAVSELLKIELKSIPDMAGQFDRLMAADLTFVPAGFSEVMHRPTADDVDALIDRYGTGSPKQRRDVVVLLAVHPIAFSDRAWLWLTDLLNRHDHDLHVPLFRMLTLADATRFGRYLATQGWQWSASAHNWINHYGSGALIEAEAALPFERLAPRLAPWRLLEAARIRGSDPAEVRLAAEMLGCVLIADRLDEPDPGSELTVNCAESGFPPFVLSARPRLWPDVGNDATPSPRTAPDAGASAKSGPRLFETADARIDEARRSGASLYFNKLETTDLQLAFRHAPDMVDRWLEGAHPTTADFRRRVRLAELCFLALCEALLIDDPARGTMLWRALDQTLATRYVGAAGVDEMLQIAFRVPDSHPVSELRKEIVSLPRCHSDGDLLEVATAASCNGRADWIMQMAAADRASSLVWRQRRAVVLASLGTGYALPVSDAWPEGETRTAAAALRRKAARLRLTEACARHWWRTYWAARDSVGAYAAWVLFSRSADSRAWTWMSEDLNETDARDDFHVRKLAHVRLNRSRLKYAMERRLNTGATKFLNQSTVQEVGPWWKAPGVA